MKKIFTLFLSLVFAFSFANYSANTELACPTAAISYPGSPFCSNISSPQTVAMTGTDTYTGGTFSSMPGLAINTATGTITPSLSTPGTYTVSYTIQAGAGCPGFLTTTTVTITLLPAVIISYPGTPYCKSQTAPQPVVITGTGAYTGGTYMSTAGLSINAVTGAITPSASAAGTYTVTYTAPASGGCMTVPATATVTIYDAPTATIASNQTICFGSSTTINFTGTPNTTVSYNINGGPNQSIILNSSGNATLSTGPLTTTTTYNLTSATFACSSPVSGSVTITVNAAPTVTVNSPTVCSGSNATVTATPGATGSYFYTWTVPAGAINPGNVASFTTTVGGTYSVIARNSATGCSSMSTSGTVTVNPAGGSMNLQCGLYNQPGHSGEIYIDWSTVTGITTYNYSYSINGGPIVTGSQNSPSSIYILTNGQPITFTLSGTGSVCVNPITITCGTLSIDENGINDFVISPNPVTDILNIKNNQTINKATVFNQLGQMVLQRAYNNNEVQLDFSGLKTGIYFISVDSDTKQSTFKIVKN